jgi:hypothetical protein
MIPCVSILVIMMGPNYSRCDNQEFVKFSRGHIDCTVGPITGPITVTSYPKRLVLSYRMSSIPIEGEGIDRAPCSRIQWLSKG